MGKRYYSKYSANEPENVTEDDFPESSETDKVEEDIKEDITIEEEVVENPTIKELKRKIDFWISQLENTKNSMEIAILIDKINNAKKELANIEKMRDEKKVHSTIDVPSIADKTGDESFTKLERGEIMDSGNNNIGIII